MQKTHIVIISISFLPFLAFSQVTTKDNGWVGSIIYDYLMYDKGEREEMGVRNEWQFYRKARIVISVKGVNIKEKNTDDWNKEKNIGHAYMTDKLNKWQQETRPWIKEVKHIQIISEEEKGIGEGKVNVWVEMNVARKKYSIKTDGPMYNVTRKARIWSNVIEMGGGGSQPEEISSRINDGIGIDVYDQNIGNDPKHLSGTYEVLNAGNIKVTVTWNLRKDCPSWNNPITQTNLSKLDPIVKAAATRFIQRVNDELCIRLKVTAGFRTIPEQDYEYSKGRTISSGINVSRLRPLGETVTGAKGGQSNHNFGRAIDVYYATDNGIDFEPLAADIVEIARQEGFEWGGYWRKPDYPHFEMKK